MLKDCIPDIFYRTDQVKELFDAEQPELDQLTRDMDIWRTESFILTATLDTIQMYEDDYVLDHDDLLTIEQRRARVFAKRNERYRQRIADLELRLKVMLGAQRVIIEENNCSFTVYVETARLAENISIAKKFFKDARPAHFGYVFINEIRRQYVMTEYVGIAAFVEKTFSAEVGS